MVLDCFLKIIISGESAGGNIATVISRKLKDHEFKPLAQVLLYPVLQTLNLQLPSFQRYGKRGPVLKLYDMVHFSTYYLLGHIDKEVVSAMMTNSHIPPEVKRKLAATHFNTSRLPEEFFHPDYKTQSMDQGSEEIWNKMKHLWTNPDYSPFFAEDLTNMPQAFVFISYHDILRDEGFLYVKKLQDCGVPVTYVVEKSAYHGLAMSIKSLKDGHKMRNAYINYIQGIIGSPSSRLAL